MISLSEQARIIATVAHHGQFRRDGKTPYIKHPEDVAFRCVTEEEKTVAWLHDVVEDTRISATQLNALFPAHIVQAVVFMSKIHGETEEEYVSNLKRSPLAVRVKLHDMASNLADSPTDKQKDKYRRIAKALLGI